MIKSTGTELVPNLVNNTDRDERYREPFDASDIPGISATNGAIKRGRRADAIEQLSRAGGLPRMSGLSSILALIDQNGRLPGLSDVVNKGSVQGMVGPPGKSPQGKSRWGGKAESSGQARLCGQVEVRVAGRMTKEDEDYDTEEETDVRRKRQKFHSASRVAPPTKPKAKPSMDVKSEAENEVASIRGAPVHVTLTRDTRRVSPSPLSDTKPEVKVEATSPISPSSGSIPLSSSSQSRPAVNTRHRSVARFSIDKQHLRAYARAAAHVDDL